MSLGTVLDPPETAVDQINSTQTAGVKTKSCNSRASSKNRMRGALTISAAILIMCGFAECLARMLACMTVPADGKDRAFDAKMLLANQIQNDKDPAVIFIGNSITNQGVYADLIQERLRQKGFKVKVLNLGTTGSCIQEKLQLLDAATSNSSGPRFIVFQVSPAEFEEEFALISDPSAEFFASYVGKNSKFRPASMQKSFWDKAFDWLDQYSYLSRYRKHWCESLHYAINYVTNPELFRSRGPLPNVHSQCSLKGWSPWYGFATEADLDMYTQTAFREFHTRTGRLPAQEWKWDCSRIEKMNSFCKEKNLPLTLLWLPELSDKTLLYKVKHFSPGLCVKRLSPWLASNNVGFLDWHDTDKEPTHFSTWNHHNALGATHNSETLAQWLANTQFAKQFGDTKNQTTQITQSQR